MSGETVTRLLALANEGRDGAAERLFEAVYQELRQVARRAMLRERPGHTLQSTALVNEAYLRLVGDAPPEWSSRAHFFGAAAEAMRRVLVEHARRRAAAKRGAAARKVTLADVAGPGEGLDLDVIELDRAVEALGAADADLARIVKLRYFVGLTIEETAEVVGKSPASVKRDWTYARAWLYRRMGS